MEGKGGFLLQGFLEKIFNSLKNVLSLNLFEFLKKWLTLLGDYGLYVGAVLVILIGMISSIRLESFSSFLYSIGFAVAFLIVQFISSKFNAINENLVNSNETYMTSNGFTDALAIFSIIAGIVYFFMNLYLAIKLPKFMPFLEGLGILIVFSLISLISFNPKLVSVKSVKKNSAGEEAIGILGFFIKLAVKLVPFIYGVGIIFIVVSMIVNAVGIFGNKFEMAISWAKVFKAMVSLLIFGLLPFFAYLSFVFNFLLIDIIKSVLLIPEKLDKLSK